MLQRNSPKAVGIFSGVGGACQGFEQAGFKHLLAVDFDKHAVEAYRQNFPESPIEQWDMFEKNGQDILLRIGLAKGELDLLHCEASCRFISTAGLRDPEAKDAQLLLSVTPQLIRDIQPKSWFIENVDGLIKGSYLPVFYDLKRKLDELKDYNWDFRILNALDYNTPTIRKRFIAIGVRKDISSRPITFPKPTTIDYNALRANQVAKHLLWLYTGYFFRESKKKHARNFMYTLTKTMNVKVRTTEGEKRFLNYAELLMFNGFPRDWKIPGSLSLQWARIGNAVPPPLAYSVAKHIRDEFFQSHRENK